MRSPGICGVCDARRPPPSPPKPKPSGRMQRRHSPKCPDRPKGPGHLKCKLNCKLRICGYDDEGNRIRESLGTRDLARAQRLLAKMYEAPFVRAHRKNVADAIDAFLETKVDSASETMRKWTRNLGFLAKYCRRVGLEFVGDVTVESLDGYAGERRRPTVTWTKEVEQIRSFFEFCQKRSWCKINPAESIRIPKLRRDEDEIVPFTVEQVACIIAACDRIGKTNYERSRARAMVLLLRFTGMRISDVVTLSREHVINGYIKKRAIKNERLFRVELPSVVAEALERLPRPKAAPADSLKYFASDTSSVRSLVKGAQRTLSAVFKLSGVEGAFPHRFRHTFASELLGKGEGIDENLIARALGDTPAIIRKQYSKWTPELQARQDSATRKLHGTNLAQAEEMVKPC